MISSDQNNNNDDDNNNNNHNNTLLSPFPPAFFWMERLLHNSALSVFVFVVFFLRRGSMWNIPLLKLQSEYKPRTFRTHRQHWGMLEYSMATCHLKKRERRSLNSRIAIYLENIILITPRACKESTLMLHSKILIESLASLPYAYMQDPESST